MNCKFCNAVLAEEMTVCPACGKEQEAAELTEETVAVEEAPVEETPAQETVAEAAPAKANTKKLTAAIIAIVLVAGILIGMVLGGLGKQPAATPVASETEPAETAAPVEIPADGDPASPLCKASYTAADEEAAAAADVVVATMGDKTLTNAQLQAYYWQEIYMFLQENSSYAYYLGLDYTQPLDQQIMDMGGVVMSWQQFFLDGAIATWKNYQALAMEGEEVGHVMPAERQEELSTMAEEMEGGAALSGYGTADAMIAANVGANCTLADYMAYATTYYEGMSYYQSYCENLDFTTEEIETFYAENEAYFVDSGLTKDAKFVNVRHVLLMPEGTGEYGEDGYPLYTEEAWETCRQQAEELYAKWQEGDKSEESFAELANAHTADGNDVNQDGVPDGGLYEDVPVGYMVPAFNDWCFDESRQIGDHGLVKTEYGYHIMFYCGDRNWEYYARNEMISDMAYDKIPAVVEKFAPVVDFSKIVLCDIPLA